MAFPLEEELSLSLEEGIYIPQGHSRKESTYLREVAPILLKRARYLSPLRSAGTSLITVGEEVAIAHLLPNEGIAASSSK